MRTKTTTQIMPVIWTVRVESSEYSKRAVELERLELTFAAELAEEVGEEGRREAEVLETLEVVSIT